MKQRRLFYMRCQRTLSTRFYSTSSCLVSFLRNAIQCSTLGFLLDKELLTSSSSLESHLLHSYVLTRTAIIFRPSSVSNGLVDLQQKLACIRVFAVNIPMDSTPERPASERTASRRNALTLRSDVVTQVKRSRSHRSTSLDVPQ